MSARVDAAALKANDAIAVKWLAPPKTNGQTHFRHGTPQHPPLIFPINSFFFLFSAPSIPAINCFSAYYG